MFEKEEKKSFAIPSHMIFIGGMLIIMIAIIWFIRDIYLCEIAAKPGTSLPKPIQKETTPTWQKEKKPPYTSYVVPIKKEIKPLKKVNPSKGYACTIKKEFDKWIGKEIVPYSQKIENKKFSYRVKYYDTDWNTKGIEIKKQFIAQKVDLSSKMVKVGNHTWIPALSFATCVMIEDTN